MLTDGRRWDSLEGGDPRELAGAVRAILESLRDTRPEHVPARLCALCPRLLPVSGAAVSLMTPAAERRVLGWTGEKAVQLSEAQFTLGSGPCVNAFSDEAPVFAADLSNGSDARRWPLFAHRAVELGVRAVFSFPLVLGATATGTLDLYREDPGPLSETDVGIALLLADTATLSVLRIYSAHRGSGAPDGEDRFGWLGDDGHDEVHQATGMVMVQCDVGADEALLRLRGRAFARGVTVTELARAVVARRVRLDEDE